MDEIEKIQFEGPNVSSAIKWGIISIVFFGLINFLFRDYASLYSDPTYLFSYGLPAYVPFMYVLNWVVHIIIVVYAVKIAKKLNRSAFIWGILSFFFPPITLIVLGFQDYKIEDKVIKGIVDKARLDFNAEILNIKNTRDISPDELEKIESKLKEKYIREMRKNIRDSISDIETGSFSDDAPSNETDIEQPFDEAGDNGTEILENPEIILGEINTCPACGATINDKTTVCPDCGLTLK